MSELEEEWALALSAAKHKARTAGRKDILDYLTLRSANDLLRQTATEWLMTTFAVLAGEANRSGASIQLEQEERHRFRVGQATMVGRRLVLRQGVRALSIEAGWPRGPRDGVVRGGGLACANIYHLGRKQANEGLLLVRSSKGAPQWFVIERSGARSALSEARLRRHLLFLLEEPA